MLLLSAVAPERLRQAAADPAYLARYDEVMAQFNDLLTADPATTWVGQHQPELIERPVAYFSAEFGVHPRCPFTRAVSACWPATTPRRPATSGCRWSASRSSTGRAISVNG